MTAPASADAHDDPDARRAGQQERPSRRLAQPAEQLVGGGAGVAIEPDDDGREPDALGDLGDRELAER